MYVACDCVVLLQCNCLLALLINQCLHFAPIMELMELMELMEFILHMLLGLKRDRCICGVVCLLNLEGKLDTSYKTSRTEGLNPLAPSCKGGLPRTIATTLWITDEQGKKPLVGKNIIAFEHNASVSRFRW